MNLKIEKMIYGGDGLARLPGGDKGRGKTLFLPFVLEGEEVRATLVRDKGSFARGRVEEIVAVSNSRVAPPCPHFTACGGCQYQHASYEHQLAIKESILRETLARTAKLDWLGPIHMHASPPWNYRNRTRVQVRGGGQFSLGYFRFHSHQVQAVEECPISSPLINRGLKAMWKLGREKKVPRFLDEIEFFANAEDEAMLLELHTSHSRSRGIERELDLFAAAVSAFIPECRGIAAFDHGTSALGNAAPFWSYGEPELLYRTAHGEFRVRAGSFFQTNRFLTDTLIEIVSNGRAGKIALDLYAGTGLFALALANNFEHVVAVEPAPTSFAGLQSSAPANVEVVNASTEDFLCGQKRRLIPDFAVVDPPRAGLGEKVARMLAKLAAPALTYVSCDPATLSRDLRLLIESGYHVQAIHLVDMFPQTFHMETVAHMAR